MCRLCRIQYTDISLHRLLCLLHCSVVSMCRGLPQYNFYLSGRKNRHAHWVCWISTGRTVWCEEHTHCGDQAGKRITRTDEGKIIKMKIKQRLSTANDAAKHCFAQPKLTSKSRRVLMGISEESIGMTGYNLIYNLIIGTSNHLRQDFSEWN